ncbi:hypothetical protein O6H91_02G140700 [Diphasiastrum complanatum]|uniref:Uncharacterized protein n=1 Tax=Diphasiastrum complanatum TaxID=34168 RepID=A0ACC2ELA2_DIPCM|nr:hypothetical protein O6H91_02G140700 [Diphasiastrum complanatum]
MSRGLKLSQQPFHHRRLAIKPRDPPQPNIAEQQYVETPRRATSENDPRMEVRSYYLSKSMIEDLKKEAQADAYSSVTAFFWRASVRARKVALAQKASISVVMNGRRILDLPPGLFGNVVFYGVAEAEVGSLLSEPLGVAAHLVAKAVAALDRECFQSIIDMVEKQRHRLLHEGSTIRPKVYLESPDLMLSSSLASFPLYKVNFGWGCPCFVSMNPSRRYPGFLYFNRAPPEWGAGLVANIECLNAHELDIDHEFGTLARNIPQLSSLASILNVDEKQVYDH